MLRKIILVRLGMSLKVLVFIVVNEVFTKTMFVVCGGMFCGMVVSFLSE